MNSYYDNPVKVAKSRLEAIPILSRVNESGEEEFLISASKIKEYSEFSLQSIEESLNEIIATNEDSAISASNIVLTIDENSDIDISDLEESGIGYIDYNNIAGIHKSNPLDKVYGFYEAVIVAKKDNEFFIEANDIQSCAKMNEESIEDSFKQILSCNEEAGMNISNTTVIFDENTTDNTIESLEESGILLEANFSIFPRLSKDPSMKAYFNDLREAEQICKKNGITTNAEATKALRVGVKLLNICVNVASFILLPIGVQGTFIRMVWYVISRGIAFFTSNGEESIAKQEGTKVIQALDAAIAKEKNTYVRDQLKLYRNKLYNSMNSARTAIDPTKFKKNKKEVEAEDGNPQ